MYVFVEESESLTGAGKLYPGLTLKNRFCSAGDDNCKNTGSCGINLANGRFCGEKRYSSDYAGKRYSVGIEMLCLNY